MSDLRRDFLPDDFKPELVQAGFDAAIAVQARQTLAETRRLLALAAASPFIIGVIGWVDLTSRNIRSQLQEFAGEPKLVVSAKLCKARLTIGSCYKTTLFVAWARLLNLV